MAFLLADREKPALRRGHPAANATPTMEYLPARCQPGVAVALERTTGSPDRFYGVQRSVRSGHRPPLPATLLMAGIPDSPERSKDRIYRVRRILHQTCATSCSSPSCSSCQNANRCGIAWLPDGLAPIATIQTLGEGPLKRRKTRPFWEPGTQPLGFSLFATFLLANLYLLLYKRYS